MATDGFKTQIKIAIGQHFKQLVVIDLAHFNQGIRQGKAEVLFTGTVEDLFVITNVVAHQWPVTDEFYQRLNGLLFTDAVFEVVVSDMVDLDRVFIQRLWRRESDLKRSAGDNAVIDNLCGGNGHNVRHIRIEAGGFTIE